MKCLRPVRSFIYRIFRRCRVILTLAGGLLALALLCYGVAGLLGHDLWALGPRWQGSSGLRNAYYVSWVGFGLGGIAHAVDDFAHNGLLLGISVALPLVLLIPLGWLAFRPGSGSRPRGEPSGSQGETRRDPYSR